jgi:hypothetical protein
VGDSEPKRGIGEFAGKSGIAEGRCDLRKCGDSVSSADLPVKRELRPARLSGDMRLSKLRCGGNRDAAQSWAPRKSWRGGAAVPVKSRMLVLLVPFPFDFSSRLRGFLD